MPTNRGASEGSETLVDEYSTRRIQFYQVHFYWDHDFTCFKNRRSKNDHRKMYPEVAVALLVCWQINFSACVSLIGNPAAVIFCFLFLAVFFWIQSLKLSHGLVFFLVLDCFGDLLNVKERKTSPFLHIHQNPVSYQSILVLICLKLGFMVITRTVETFEICWFCVTQFW